MYELPTTISVGDKEYPIRNNGDYRMVLDCFLVLEDGELTKQERILTALIIFLDGFETVGDIYQLENAEDVVHQMFLFFNCGQEDTHVQQSKPKLIDWEKDSTIICSAINNVARTEVRALPYLHWWTFMGYYMAINEGFFSTIMNIRHKISTNKKLEKHEQEFRKDNPQYFVWDSVSVDKQEADELARSIWNSNGVTVV